MAYMVLYLFPSMTHWSKSSLGKTLCMSVRVMCCAKTQECPFFGSNNHIFCFHLVSFHEHALKLISIKHALHIAPVRKNVYMRALFKGLFEAFLE